MVNNYWRTRNEPYKPGEINFKVSRSKIELFVQCQRCFWLDVRLKITRPNSPPFNINNAIDELFKKEFDIYRFDQKPHPLMVQYNINAIPFQHSQLKEWRETFVGVVALHKMTKLHVFGAVDDLWVDPDGTVYVVDYKATSKKQEVTIDSDWQISYKRQLEVYQWLLRQNDIEISDVGYFVYTNARVDLKSFNDNLQFSTKIIPYKGNDNWVEPTLIKMKECMDNDAIPPVGIDIMGGPCSYCSYARSRTELTLKTLQSKKI